MKAKQSVANATMKEPAMQRGETHCDLADKVKTATLANMMLFFVVVVAASEFRLTSRTINLGFWTIIPAMVLPIWLRFWRIWDTFLWSKLVSLIPVAVVSIEVSRRDGNPRVLQPVWFTLLSINIAEAVALDLLSKKGRRAWSPLNAISGVLLILSEIPSIHTIRISKNQTHDLLWTLGVPWIIAYTIWNWMLVLNNYPYAIGRHTAILLAAIVLSLEDGWDVWFEARVYTLAFYALLRSTFYNQFRRLADVHDPFPSIQSKHAIQLLAFVCNLVLLGILLVR
jgi:hypothetical protein